MKPTTPAAPALFLASLLMALPIPTARCALAPGDPIPLQEVVPSRSADALVNPGMGLYATGTLDPSDLPPDVWYAPLIQVCYFRDDWAVLEPDEEGT